MKIAPWGRLSAIRRHLRDRHYRARATNIRAGAHGPVSSMLHAVFLLGFMLVAAPLASYIPLAALAVVAWNMIEKHAFAALMRSFARC